MAKGGKSSRLRALGDHAAVAEHNFSADRSVARSLWCIHLRGHCFGIGRVAAENFYGDGTPACVGAEWSPKTDLRITGFIVAGSGRVFASGQ